MGLYKDYIKHGLFFNGEQLTQESIDKCIEQCIQNKQGCIDEVQRGEVTVNDKEKYFEWCNSNIKKYENRDFKISLSFLQKAYYIQTGKCVALLP
ncbi:hypothetical protein HYO65_gp211 [Tenacibaculum phage PTm1]|uniref:Uncharacterized protein n=2 Tax=Shirahamavirus PTm1 TaxID=2846435 RepID=A0A5S9HXI0_9CAUD|nr:hypothetical protein HYO65_gp211 [Tenacibaculum phage PTm1]BBI90603.1 hypothetical protein [Tenacibaculum phage PTm1]BBI90910.1 hypothetical protein [Tenacibaculum phage PTm5]